PRLVRRHDLRAPELSPMSWPGLTARLLRADLVDDLEYCRGVRGFGNPFDRVSRGDGAFFADRQVESRSAAREETPDHVGPPEPGSFMMPVATVRTRHSTALGNETFTETTCIDPPFLRGSSVPERACRPARRFPLGARMWSLGPG